jgi:hypothetical protein
MSAVVQATCPGCNNVLRIPADWLHQAIRCKQCGTVLQARTPAARPVKNPAPQPKKAPPAQAVPAAVARPAATYRAAPANGSPFGDLADDDTNPRRRRRRRGTPWWTGPLIALAVMLLAGAAAALNWSRIKNILEVDAPILPAPASPEVAITGPKDKGGEAAVEPQKPAVVEAPKQAPKETKRPTPATKPPARPTPATRPAAKKPTPPEKRPDPPQVVTEPPRPDPTRKPAPLASAFPRRALVISVRDYLYANPVHYGLPVGTMHNLKGLLQALGNPDVGMKIPRGQVFHLSDHAATGARYPTKPVIERAISSFLETSRPQDRVLVFFVGHAVEIGDEAYLVPIEGELENAAGLVPLKWVYQQLQACKARQKVLVLDTNRLNSTLGQERPIAGPMGPKLDAVLKSPPPGVQVWSACVEKQHSYETDNPPRGVFLDEIESAQRKGLANKIQHPQDPLPLEQFIAAVNRGMASELAPRNLQQVSRLSGKELDAGAAYDPKEAAPKPPDLGPIAVADRGPARAILQEVGVPPIKGGADDTPEALAMLPFSAEMLKKYEAGGAADTPLRQAVRKARAYLYAVAVSPGQLPADLAPEIDKAREALKNVNLSKVLTDGYRAPAGGTAENRLKEMVANDGRQVARVMLNLTEVLDELKEAGDRGRDAEPKRWQANYDFVLARLQAQIAYLYEYQSMLGQMRKEFPPRDPTLHGGWRLAAQTSLQGDAAGKKLYKNSQKILEKLAKDNPGTPWEVLAKREKLTALGLEWQPTK